MPPAPVAVGAVASALVVGLMLGARPHLGVGLLVALLYAPVVLINLRAGIAAYTVLLMLRTWTFVSVGPTAAGILILFGWLGSLRDRLEWTRLVLSRRMLALGIGFFGWLTLSALWAHNSGDVFREFWVWYIAGMTGLIVMTSLATRRSVQMVLGAFVGGAVLAVIVGYITSGFAAGTPDPGALTEGRLTTGVGDPNDLAAALVPATMIAIGLLATVRSPIKRWPLLAAIVVLVLGIAGTESRGGFLAIVVALVASCVVFKERRAQMTVAVGISASLLAFALTITGAWSRVTELGDGGSGRSDLWHVAWRIFQDHPILGVGLNNFRAVSADYTREAGQLKSVFLLVDSPHLVHNVYLQLLAETGVVGLGLFLCLMGGAVLSARRAASNFERRGERGLATLSRAVCVGLIGMLTASFFLSSGADGRMWVLVGICPALLGLSRRAGPALEE